jgi:hypothetical protein
MRKDTAQLNLASFQRDEWTAGSSTSSWKSRLQVGHNAPASRG